MNFKNSKLFKFQLIILTLTIGSMLYDIFYKKLSLSWLIFVLVLNVIPLFFISFEIISIETKGLSNKNHVPNKSEKQPPKSR